MARSTAERRRARHIQKRLGWRYQTALRCVRDLRECDAGRMPSRETIDQAINTGAIIEGARQTWAMVPREL